MADICYPPDTDWSAAYPKEEDYDKAREANDALFEMAEMYAWTTLAALTNYRLGTCPITVRPCALRAFGESSLRTAVASGGYTAALGRINIGMFNPYITGGQWVNACGCRRSCECTTAAEVHLPGPVARIVNVTVDGVILPSSAYKVISGTRLLRLDGEKWPLCQDLGENDDDFSVTYYRGSAPNAMVRFAAGVLANEFLLGFEHSDECRLPDNLTSLNRSGESYNFQPSDFPGGKTGILEVDRVIDIYNPHNLRAPVIVASADDYAGTPVRTWGRRGY